jgi:uncharacterized protein (TIGR02996 family)
MQAWLERVYPSGEKIKLPDGSGVLVFGRSSKATLVFDEPAVSARHCEVRWETGFFWVKDLGSELGTQVNGSQVTSQRALFNDDLVTFGGVRLRFKTDLPADDPALLLAIARDPDAEEPWLVYADQLQEHGDPLGERISRSRTGGRVDHQPWLGPLWDAFINGSLEIDWALGFARRVTLRSVAGRLALDWRAVASTMFNLRIGRFVGELTVDVPRLEHTAAREVHQAIMQAQEWLAAQPSTPATLRSLQLGYQVGPFAEAPLPVSEVLIAKCPQLRGTSVYTRAQAAKLRVLSVSDGAKLTGIADGVRLLTGVVRVRRGTRALHLESPPGIPFMADGNPCFFSANEARVQLICGRMRGEVRVNQRIDSLFELLPGDVIDVQAAAKFRFEVA